MNWHLIVSLATVSVVLIAILIKGIHSFGRIVFCTATLPLCILIAIFVRSLSLDGASEGIFVTS
jgi:hypothetical protein